MKIQIFDVEHGFCSLITASNGNLMLFDCGHNNTTGFHPADYLSRNGCNGIERLFITNYDSDHVSGLPELRRRCHIGLLHRNTSIAPAQLRALKLQRGPLRPAMENLIDMMGTYTGGPSDVSPEFPGIEFVVFWNDYPTFTDTNNLSMVVFVRYPGISIVYPGDLEQVGWQRLLQEPSFRACLRDVNIFVASHHGRESGYQSAVFDHCSPAIVIISDTTMRYETQENCYRQHASGIRWNEDSTRRVLTTRRDGMLTITPREGAFHIQASR